MGRCKDFADRLNKFMNEKDVSSNWLHRETGCAQTCIAAARRGDTLPTRQKARMLAIALDKPSNVFDDLYLPRPLPGEMWRPIQKCPSYLISNLGRVANANTGRIKRTYVNQRGYEVAEFEVVGTRHLYIVDRLVKEAFSDAD